ncbi:MAG: FMN-binding protein [Spirochaetota bacterium]
MRRMIVVLTAVMILSGLVLAATYSGLSTRIEANRAAALSRSLASIFAGVAGEGAELAFEELDVDGPTVYRASTTDGSLLGYAVRVETQGYGGTITLLAGLSEDLETIIGIEIAEQVETPGLGGNITESEFKRQFAGLDAEEPVTYVKNIEPNKDANEIQAISGATITSRAITSGINRTLGEAIDAIERQAQ